MSSESKTFGLSQSQFQLLLKLLEPLRPSCQIWLFGSRVNGAHQEYSDIDLLIEGQPGRRLQEVRTALEESSLPYKVDLVLAEDLSSEYREQVYRERVRVL